MVRFERLFKISLILSALLLGTFSVQASEGLSATVPLRGGGGDVPWPWGLELPFPWDGVQGVWKVENKKETFYFGFRRVADKRLVVTQFDANRCMTLGTGPGLIRNKSQKFVVSQITMRETGDVYRMAIYAFAEQDAPVPPSVIGDEVPQHVVVARISSLSNNAEREVALQMVRVSDRMELKCIGQDRRLRF